MTQRPNPRTDPCAVGGESLSSPFHMPPCQGLWFSGSISDGVLGEPLCFPWWLAGKLHLPTFDSMTRFFFFLMEKCPDISLWLDWHSPLLPPPQLPRCFFT